MFEIPLYRNLDMLACNSKPNFLEKVFFFNKIVQFLTGVSSQNFSKN